MNEAPPTPETQALGRVGCPVGQEANVDEFYFWVAPGSLVEQTQIVRAPTRAGGVEFEVFGVVEQVYRRSTISTMHMELAAHDGNPVADDLALERDGVTYAKARVINCFLLGAAAGGAGPLTPPVEGSTVFSCGHGEAERAYGMDAYADDRGVTVGLIRNGSTATAGRAILDMDFLLGAQAGHLNVNGAAGSGTKSSFLTIATAQTVNAIKTRAAGLVGSGERPRIKVIVFNVKGFDLFFLDRWSRRFSAEDAAIWHKMGVDRPGVFESVAYYAPERPERGGTPIAISTPRPGETRPYSWSLRDVVDFGLFDLLFSEETRANENLSTLIDIMRRRLSTRRGEALSLRERLGVEDGAAADARRQLTEGYDEAFNGRNPDNIATFESFLSFVAEQAEPSEARDELTDDSLRRMNNSTILAFYRRLLRVLSSRSGLLRREETAGAPLTLATAEEDVHVIDIQSIPDQHLQRFVIASVLSQLVDWRSGPFAARNEIFLVVIDELNRYAPRGAADPITRLFEYVASQMRSRGIILFGAQQQGSRVSEVVIENSQTRVLGRSGGQELADPVWRGFAEGDRKLALRLGPDEKVVVAPNFREALHVRVPRPPWAMRPEEAADTPPSFLAEHTGMTNGGSPAVSAEARRRAAAFEP